jgi:hypothetical protein
MTGKPAFRLCLASLGMLIGLSLSALIAYPLLTPRHPAYRPPSPPELPPTVTPIDAQALRQKAWEQVEPLLAQADQAGLAAITKRLAAIPAFVDERKQGAAAFAAALVGLKGKYELIKSKLRSNGADEYAQWIREQFAAFVFTGEELTQLVEGTVRSVLTDWQEIDNRLLIRIRADLSDGDLADSVLPPLQSDALFKARYDALSTELLPVLTRDLKLAAGREVASLVAGQLATSITLKVATAVAVRLGLSAGILSAGAASGVATFGIGMIACFVVDQVIGQVMKLAGYDPEEQVAGRVTESLDELARLITDGDSPPVVSLMGGSGVPTAPGDRPSTGTAPPACLRTELIRLHAARVSVRTQALSRLFHPEGSAKAELLSHGVLP